MMEQMVNLCTGFDVPSLATMYVYKPMKGYNLMQAIARVNRVFSDKEGSQLGLTADELAFYDALTKPQAIKDFYENEEINSYYKRIG